MKNKAVFLDRDGTINFDSNHVFDPDRLFLLPGVAEAISTLRSIGYHIVIVTNQSCIGRGYATHEQVDLTNETLQKLLLKEFPDALVDLVLTAPDHPDRPTSRRKPGEGMLLEAAKNLDLDLSICWIIGDKASDPDAGKNAGLPESNCLLVLKNQSEEVPNISQKRYQRFKGLLEASEYIKSKMKKSI